MKITTKIGYLGLLIILASLDNTMAEAKVAKTPQTISERLAKIQQKLQEKRQRLAMTNWENTDAELLTFFGDFGDSPLFGDFGDAPIFSPFGDFADSLPFGDFSDLW
ncbi:MAG: hypothetical protein QNJ60_15805 [Xenococcaceae cyanobacterium MO_188.B19]|nr:hypothetical protein [Xenococcaceae cyanobacterium MO_188.B19]